MSFNYDKSRENRLGFPEIIYGKAKTADELLDILLFFENQNKNALITKLQPEKYQILKTHFAGSFYDRRSGIFMLRPVKIHQSDYSVALISAGTSDMHVVNEAYYTLAFLNLQAEKITDVGVAGIHRLMDKIEYIKQFKILIVMAGFEGLLPSVVGGLLPQPVIAVPTSVGYGVAESGKTALNSMLASCANGITVTNIDNGYGAAIAAFRILNLLKK